jgi:sugar (pentulose or hexulose) kinase
MMGAIGTGNVQPGVVTVSLGTSGTVYAYSAEPVIDPEGEVAAFCDSTDRWLPLACTMNVTVATEQRASFSAGTTTDGGADRRHASGCGGLLFLPYLTGERTPNLPHGSGVLHGLTTDNMHPAHLARATMEGVTLGIGYGLGRLPRAGDQSHGDPAHRWWEQEPDLAADLCGCLRRADGLPAKLRRRRSRQRHPGRASVQHGEWKGDELP